MLISIIALVLMIVGVFLKNEFLVNAMGFMSIVGVLLSILARMPSINVSIGRNDIKDMKEMMEMMEAREREHSPEQKT